MSFSYQCERTGYTYAGTNLGGLFARPANLFKRDHWRMLSDILRFNRAAPAQLQEDTVNGDTLGSYLEKGEYSAGLRRALPAGHGFRHLVRARRREMLEFPAEAFPAVLPQPRSAHRGRPTAVEIRGAAEATPT